MTLYKGDCLEVMKDIPDGSVDCIVTSPPYWKGFAYEAYFNSYAQYLRWCKKWMRECKRILKSNGTFYLNVINDSEITVRAFDLMQIATEQLMYKLHDTIIWYRYNQQPANTTRQLTNQVEYIFMLRHTSAGVELNKKAAFKLNPHIFKTKNVGNVWEIPFNSGKKSQISFGRKETKSKFGHSGFPLELPETCISLSTKENDTVLDLFMGTGQTGIACKKLKRNFIGIELDDNAFKLSEQRIKETEYKLF
jgi:site-specific DNA-methyltransferase (adenine-specific)|tara:strand:+ start:40 stop:789 length:750 start_codon:yes stop_codon:yes gene_type:complete